MSCGNLDATKSASLNSTIPISCADRNQLSSLGSSIENFCWDNGRDHPVAAKKLTIRKRLIRDLGASHCSSDFDISGKQS